MASPTGSPAAPPRDIPPQSQDHHPGHEHEMTPRPQYQPRYRGSDRLAGKVALITGGDSGMGRALGVLFAREGAKVVFVYLEEDQDAQETVRLIEAEGSQALAIRGDLRRKSECERAVSETLARFNGLDVLINHAAVQYMAEEFAEITEDQLRRTVDTNILGYMFMTQAALPHLQAGSCIINTSSVVAYKGNPMLIDYAATRGAAAPLTRSLAAKLADRGIRVNAVAPGPIWTPFTPSTFPPEVVESFGQDVPLGRPGQPNEVAPADLFLACQDASYITGQTIHPNGGTPVNG